MKTTRLLLIATLAGLVAASVAAGAAARSSATITGSFADSCRDFEAHSSKDISHIELHYADGRVVKDETIVVPDYSLDGGAGDELDSVDVKSGTTVETFTCTQSNSPPTAVLEILLPADCSLDQDVWRCDGRDERTVWRAAGAVHFACFSGDPACDTTARVRGTMSNDPDNDIESWTIEFLNAGGAVVSSVSGDWTTDPPIAIAGPVVDSGEGHVTLTVTDSAGQSDSDSMLVGVGRQD